MAAGTKASAEVALSRLSEGKTPAMLVKLIYYLNTYDTEENQLLWFIISIRSSCTQSHWSDVDS